MLQSRFYSQRQVNARSLCNYPSASRLKQEKDDDDEEEKRHVPSVEYLATRACMYFPTFQLDLKTPTRHVGLYTSLAYQLHARDIAMLATNIYFNYQCGSSVPTAMMIAERSSCTSSGCESSVVGADWFYYSTTSCPSDAKTYAAEVYGSNSYVLMDIYNDGSCDAFSGTVVLHALGVCAVAGSWSQRVITTMNSNGTIQVEFFSDSECSYPSSSPFIIDEETLTTHSCTNYGVKFYSNSAGSATDGTEDSSGLSAGAIIGIVAGILVFVLLVVGIVIWRCRRKKAQRQGPVQTPATMEQAVPSGQYHTTTISQ
ncbi:hypothetical protein BBJ28_00015832 [Nothophytophthora sp. Chile5]|nr:hypothetical protein BBJ28_00015832 [Nothophytophthora sp. Chile5]